MNSGPGFIFGHALFQTSLSPILNLSILLVELCFRRFAPSAIFLSQIDLNRLACFRHGEHFFMVFERKSTWLPEP